MHEARARAVGRRGDGARSFDVDRCERRSVDSADDAGQMDDRVDALKRAFQCGGFERSADDRDIRGNSARRTRADDGANRDAASGKIRRQMPADEPRRAGDRHRSDHASATTPLLLDVFMNHTSKGDSDLSGGRPCTRRPGRLPYQ